MSVSVIQQAKIQAQVLVPLVNEQIISDKALIDAAQSIGKPLE